MASTAPVNGTTHFCRDSGFEAAVHRKRFYADAFESIMFPAGVLGNVCCIGLEFPSIIAANGAFLQLHSVPSVFWVCCAGFGEYHDRFMEEVSKGRCSGGEAACDDTGGDLCGPSME